MVLTSLLTFFAALILVLLAVPPVIRVAREKHLFDEPSEDRKIHVYKTPNLGGVAIFISIILTFCLFIPFNLIPHSNYIIASTILLFTLGLKDDLVGLSPLIKFAAQIVAAVIVCYFADIRLTSMYGFFGITDISMPLSIMISTLVVLLVVNSFNLIDGIDCLAGMVGLIATITFSYCFFQLGQFGLMYLSLAVAGALIGFLYFNRSPAKIFMGDTGSLMLGFLVAILSIKFVEINKFNLVTNVHPLYKSAPAVICGILVIPIFDTLRVFTLRLAKGMSPFNADRNHIHHRLIDFNLTHLQSTGILTFINIFFIGVVFLLRDMGTLELFLFITILALAFNLISWHFYNMKMRSDKIAEEEFIEAQKDNVVKLGIKESLILEQKDAFVEELVKKINAPSN